MPYIPFILPFIDPPASVSPQSPPASPLEEETRFPAGQTEWDIVAQRIKKAYGLPLLTRIPPCGRVHPLSVSPSHLSPGRCLILETDTAAWFVLEHPSGLPLYDRFGTEDQRPALARPSLFSQWFSEAGPLRKDGAAIAPIKEPRDTEALTALNSVLSGLVKDGAPSDWHLEPGRDGFRSSVRIDGKLVRNPRLSREKGEWLINSIISQAGMKNQPPGVAREGSFTFPVGPDQALTARLSLVPSIHGVALALRFQYPMTNTGPAFGSLGLSRDQIERIDQSFRKKDGLWLLAGPTGSGKTTTLQALLRFAIELEEKVLAVEDPVEHRVAGVQQVQVDASQGADFPIILKAFMRQSPDCILVGEIRDPETAATALQAAHSGHRVLSSIHATNWDGLIRRLSDLEQPMIPFTSIFQMVIHQRLIRLLCQKCRIRSPSAAKALPPLIGFAEDLPTTLPLARGCPLCHEGYHGRTGIYALSCQGEERINVREALLGSAWNHFKAGRTSVEGLLPYLPDSIRTQFPLCQV